MTDERAALFIRVAEQEVIRVAHRGLEVAGEAGLRAQNRPRHHVGAEQGQGESGQCGHERNRKGKRKTCRGRPRDSSHVQTLGTMKRAAAPQDDRPFLTDITPK